MMKRGAFLAVCAAGALVAGCSAAGDDNILKFDGGVGPAPTPDAAAGEANVPVQLIPAVPCDASTPCTGAIANFCYMMSTGSGYCTSAGCASAADCPAGYFCDVGLSPSVCRRPPTGEGTPCAAPQDCAAFEANYCETAVSRTCLLQGCSQQLNNCDDTRICCDFASWGLPSLCIDKVLSGGKCTQ